MNILTKTADGSNTLFNQSVGEHYHSAHGAVQESNHVFVNAGFDHFAINNQHDISILEVGFGTGLNFLLTSAHAQKINRKFSYTGIEAFPLPLNIITKTEYDQYVDGNVWKTFIAHYEPALADEQALSALCQLSIIHTQLQDFSTDRKFDIIYFDAFSVRHQPEMWTDEIIQRVCGLLKTGGIFVTYAITGNLKRAVKSAGLTIEKLPGAPGKREMLRATKSVT